MSYHSRIEAKNPDEIEMEMTISMTLGDWREIAESLNEIHPAMPCHFLRRDIESMVLKAEQSFYPERQEEE